MISRASFYDGPVFSFAQAFEPFLQTHRVRQNPNSSPGGTMLTRAIPSSGEEIGVIGLGTYRAFDAQLTADKKRDLTDVLTLFFDAGGSVIDSSPMYGRAEDTVGQLLSEMKAHDQAWLATKVWTRGRDKGVREMDRSLDKLAAPHIALMQVHNLVDCDTHLDTLRNWKAEGRIRYIGITHYTSSALDELSAYLKRGGIDFVQFPYSIEDRVAEDWFLPLCADLGVATLINRPLEQGGFARLFRTPVPGWAADIGCTTWPQLLLKYLLADPAVTCLIPATSNPDHMRDNLRAGVGDLPDATLRRRLRNEIG